jgi:hypothetical protein
LESLLKPIVRALALVAVVASLACSEKAPEAAAAPAAAAPPVAAPAVPGAVDTAAADIAPADIAPNNADAVANALEKELDAELAEDG